MRMATLADLYISLGPKDGAAGSVFYTVQYTNTSLHPVTLRGYPGISVTDVYHMQIGDAASRNSQPYDTVTIKPGDTAVSVFRTNSEGLAPCRKVAKYLRVFPPGSVAAILIPAAIRICGAFDTNPVKEQ